jgi:Zn-dependent alcohol dehydrogenase
MITQRLQLDDVDAAVAALGQGEVVRQVVIYD